jgi:hypothetical protein
MENNDTETPLYLDDEDEQIKMLSLQFSFLQDKYKVYDSVNSSSNVQEENYSNQIERYFYLKIVLS